MSSHWFYTLCEKIGYWSGYAILLVGAVIAAGLATSLTLKGMAKQGFWSIVIAIIFITKILIDHRKSMEKIEDGI